MGPVTGLLGQALPWERKGSREEAGKERASFQTKDSIQH